MAAGVSDATRPATPDSGAANDEPPPELQQAAKDLGQAGIEVGRSAWGVVRHFRTLLAADLALSRVAFGVTLAWAGVAIVLGASAWLLAMVSVVLWLQSTGWVGWQGAVLIPAIVSAAGGAVCVRFAAKAFADTSLNATRRQLVKLGMAEDPERVEQNPEQLP